MSNLIEAVRANVREGLESLFLRHPDHTIRCLVEIAMHLWPVVGLWWLLIGLGVGYMILLGLVLWVR